MCVIPRQLTTFKGAAKAIKLFAKHIKVMAMADITSVWTVHNDTFSQQSVFLSVQIEEQVKLLQKGVTHIGVGTPARINALIEKGRCGDEFVTVKLQSTHSLWKKLGLFCFFFLQRVWPCGRWDTWSWTGTGGTRSSEGWRIFLRWATAAPCWLKKMMSLLWLNTLSMILIFWEAFRPSSLLIMSLLLDLIFSVRVWK